MSLPSIHDRLNHNRWNTIINDNNNNIPLPANISSLPYTLPSSYHSTSHSSSHDNHSNSFQPSSPTPPFSSPFFHYDYDDSQSNNWYSHSIPINNSTNNISELYAIHVGIQLLHHVLSHIDHNHDISSNNLLTRDIYFITDSQYVCNVLGYGSYYQHHHSIINTIRSHLQSLTHYGTRKIYFYWIKGHSNHPCNDYVDMISKNANINAIVDSSHIPSRLPPLLSSHPHVDVSTDRLFNLTIPILIGQFPSTIGPKHQSLILQSTSQLLSSFYNIKPF